MNLKNAALASLVLSLALFGTNCSKKKAPSTTADSDTSSTTTEVPNIDDDGSDSASSDTMVGDAWANLPTIYFDFDQASVNADGRSLLQGVANSLGGDDGARLTIEGHCDERGTREYNLALGERRANAVKSYLVRLGVDSSRISTVSYGKERPDSIGSSSSSWSQNRRAVTTVTY